MLKRSVETFSGAVLVYIVVAACSAADSAKTESGASSGGALGASGSATAAGGTAPASSGASASGGGGTSILDPVPAADAAEDGTRIVNRYLTTADGLKTPAGFWDTQREEPCFFGTATDGQLRCMPAATLWAISTSYFADSSCTLSVYAASVDCDAPKYVVTNVAGSGCSAGAGIGYQIFELGGDVTGNNVYLKSGSSCVASGTGSADRRYFIRGPEVPASSFAAGAYQNGK